METGHRGPLPPGTRDRLLERLDHLVSSGRLTASEAARVREAADPEAFEQVAREISARHARERIETAGARTGDVRRPERPSGTTDSDRPPRGNE